MDGRLNYPWQQTVVDAFLAPVAQLPSAVAIAERAILARLKESHQLDQAERIALDDALRSLRVLLSEIRRNKRSAPGTSEEQKTG